MIEPRQEFCGITPGHPPHDIQGGTCGGYPPSGYSQNPVMVLRRDISYGDISQSLWFWCPGCVLAHRVNSRLPETSAEPKYPLWDWDGNVESPTFAPSIKCEWNYAGIPSICHSFIRNGVWEFLNDCTHWLVGKKIPMVPVPDWLANERA